MSHIGFRCLTGAAAPISRRGEAREDGLLPLLRLPIPSTGTVEKVIFDLKPGSHEDEKAPHKANAHVAAAHGISA